MPDRHVLFMVSDFAPQPSIGRIRTQKMCKFLPALGWRSSVLTIEPPPGTLTDPALLAEVPPETAVHRVRCPQPVEVPVRLASRVVQALRRPPGGPGKHQLARGGEPRSTGKQVYPCHPAAPASRSHPHWLERASVLVDRAKRGLTRRTMIPDNTVTAVPGMVRAAVKLIRRERVDLLLSSVPGFSPWLAAVLAGQRTGVPVVVDYRDLWHRDVLRTWIGPVRRRFELGLERWALARTQAVVGASEGKTRFVRELDRTAEDKPYVTIYNGFDDDDLGDVQPHRLEGDGGRLVLLYTGRLYGHRRIDPLIEAIGRLVSAGRIPGARLRVRLLGTIETDQQRRIDAIVLRYHLHDVVESGGYVTRREALAQQLGADGAVLIVDPGETSAGVLPGKITEYLGMGCFVLAVCPPGEARAMLERYGHAAWASADRPDLLEAAVITLFERWQNDPGFASRRGAEGVVPTRRQNAEQLADLLDEVLERRTVPARAVTAGPNPARRWVTQ